MKFPALQRPALNSLLRFRVKTMVFILILYISGMAAGAGATYAQLHLMGRRKPNSSLFLAVPAVKPMTEQVVSVAESSALAVHSVEIDQLSRENQASIADRKLMHDQIYKLTETEAADFNRLASRMDVAEARIMTAMWLFGVLWSVGLAVLLFFHFDERFKVSNRSHRMAAEKL